MHTQTACGSSQQAGRRFLVIPHNPVKRYGFALRIPADLAKYEEARAFVQDRATDPSLASRARVLMTGVPLVHGAERVIDIIEDHGGVVVCMENCTGLKPILENVELNGADPIEALAKKYYRLPCSVMTRNERRLETLRRLAAEYRPQCVVDVVWQTCVTYDVEAALVRRLVEDELGLPYLRIETDYSPSDSARIKLRLQAMYETVQPVPSG